MPVVVVDQVLVDQVAAELEQIMEMVLTEQPI
jgi:hypothetical protein